LPASEESNATSRNWIDDGPAPDRGLLAAETGARVEAALARLPERQREAIVLCHYQELGNIEAAALMEISVEALESLLSRGRRALRTALADIAPHSGVARDGRQGMRGRAAERAERLWRGTR